jgi:hemerythrin
MRAEFDDTLITGNEMIDSQHKELIAKINDLINACEANQGKEEAGRMMTYLKDYVEFHFGEEEKFQEEIAYPGIAEHKAKHAEFKETVRTLAEMVESGETTDFSSLVQKQVIDWLYSHIKAFDRSVAEYRFIRENPNRL